MAEQRELNTIASMAERIRKAPANSEAKIWALYLGSFALLGIYEVLGLFDTTMELAPSHGGIDKACLAVAALCGIAALGWSIYLTQGLKPIQRIILPPVLLLLASIGTFMLASRLAYIEVGRLDFPAGKTQTRKALFPVYRAFETHGRYGNTDYVQLMATGTELEIGLQDFAFMRNHRLLDQGSDSDQISSNGYFCILVTIEEFGSSLRILHSGSQKLPAGTVVLCPVR
jgi:hypothetical protein